MSDDVVSDQERQAPSEALPVRDVAAYVRDMATELSALSESAELWTLAALLERARVVAAASIEALDASGDEADIA